MRSKVRDFDGTWGSLTFKKKFSCASQRRSGPETSEESRVWINLKPRWWVWVHGEKCNEADKEGYLGLATHRFHGYFLVNLLLNRTQFVKNNSLRNTVSMERRPSRKRSAAGELNVSINAHGRHPPTAFLDRPRRRISAVFCNISETYSTGSSWTVFSSSSSTIVTTCGSTSAGLL